MSHTADEKKQKPFTYIYPPKPPTAPHSVVKPTELDATKYIVNKTRRKSRSNFGKGLHVK